MRYILLCCLFLAACAADTTKHRTHHAQTGRLLCEGEVRTLESGVRLVEGEWSFYYPGGGPQARGRLRDADLHAINMVRPAAAEMVVEMDDVFAVVGNRDAEDRVRPGTIVCALDPFLHLALCIEFLDHHHGIER